MKSLLRAYVLSLVALWILTTYIPGFHLTTGLKSFLLVAGGLTLLHFVATFLLDHLLGGLNFLTLGLFGLILDAALIYALTIYFPQISLAAWYFPGQNINGFILPPFDFNPLTTTVLSAIIINIIRVFSHLLV